jgi:hypothetical protein
MRTSSSKEWVLLRESVSLPTDEAKVVDRHQEQAELGQYPQGGGSESVKLEAQGRVRAPRTQTQLITEAIEGT